MTLWITIGIAACAVVGIVFVLARGWVGTASKGGADREARKRLEEMAERDKLAKKLLSKPIDRRLALQLVRLRNRLRRSRS